MSPQALAAPMHRHAREGGAAWGCGIKPRNQWHTFWNAGNEPARILEIISPAGFENFFHELVDLGGVTQAEPHALADLYARYALEMDPSSIPGLVQRFGVRFPGDPVRRAAA